MTIMRLALRHQAVIGTFSKIYTCVCSVISDDLVHSAGRRDGGDDGAWCAWYNNHNLATYSDLRLLYTESRSSYKNQFAQVSQMGNFRHHSSRLDERADRDSHERLRNVRELTSLQDYTP